MTLTYRDEIFFIGREHNFIRACNNIHYTSVVYSNYYNKTNS